MDKKSFGERIRAARKNANLSTDKLSELCKCTPISIRQIESGSRLPSVPKLVTLCNILKVTPNHFLALEMTFNLDEADANTCDSTLKSTFSKVRELSPSQIEMVCSTVDALIAHMKP